MATAWITLRHQPPYRSDAFAEGFERLGFKAIMKFPPERSVGSNDVVVTWNLNPRYRSAAYEAKRAGAALLVAENGYIPAKGDSDLWYALARDGHNGSGWWFTGNEDRWAKLGHEIQPWQDNRKGHILVAGQRGIGSEIMKCPSGLYEQVLPKIRRVLAREDRKHSTEIRFRAHPGRHAPQVPLHADLRGARAVVTWASNVANLSLLAGIPTFRTAPYHVNEAALTDLNRLTDPPLPDRLEAFRKLAWAQWSIAEIKSGLAFRTLLGDRL